MSIDSFTTDFLSGALNYSAERLYTLEALLEKDSKEKEICMGLRAVINTANAILEQERANWKDD